MLLRQIDDAGVLRFVADWDALEALVIRIYRGGAANHQTERYFARLQRRLRRGYPPLRVALSAYWPAMRAGGEPVGEDPFRALLGIRRAAELVENWRAMQLLPAARQALNEWLLDQVNNLLENGA
jgi:hypothetical protein